MLKDANDANHCH